MKFEKKEQEEIQEITGYSVDLGFSIMCNEKRVGHIFLNELLTGDYFIEWIEIFPEYRKKGYCKQTLMNIMDYLEIDEIQLETNEDFVSMYLHLGAEKLDYDDIREMYLLRLRKMS